MDNNDVEESSQKELDIQYDIHFSNSEDYSKSDRSSSIELSSFPDEIPEERRSNLSGSKRIRGEYQDGFLQDFELKIEKSISYNHPSPPKFQANNFGNYDSDIDDNLIKDDEVKSIINHWKEDNLSSVPESQQELSQNQSFEEDHDELAYGIEDYGPNLFEENSCDQDCLSNMDNDNNEFSSKSGSTVKITKDQSSLKKIASNNDEKQFICPEKNWGKKFLDNSKLKRHLLVHSGEKPYGCHICGKRFSLDFNLRTHIRTHTGEKPYVWEFPGCGKRFTQSSNLTAHLKTHSAQSLSGKGSSEISNTSLSKNFPIVYSQANDSVTESVESNSCPKKIFNVSKVKKENLVLLRNKIPKVFWIQKYKSTSQWKENQSNHTCPGSSDTPIRKVYGDVFKIERFREHRKRPCTRPTEKVKIQERISNDYSDQVVFKVEKVRRYTGLSNSFRIDTIAKPEDIDSASTKRSSRQSSKQKTPSISPTCAPEIEPINLVKIEDNYDNPILKMDAEALPYENELFLRCQNLNEELENEIQDYNIQDQLNQEIIDFEPSLEQIQKQMECESNHSYHEEAFSEAFEEEPEQGKEQTSQFRKPHHRSRLMSGVHDFYAQGEKENDSFLLGNERDTLNFEAFVTSKPFSNNFCLEHK